LNYELAEQVLIALPVVYLAGTAVPLIITDVREHRLPNKLTLPAFPLTLLCWLGWGITHGDWAKLLIALACAIGVFGLGVLANRFAGLGMGDVKLVTSQVLVLAWFNWGFALSLSLVAIVLLSLTLLYYWTTTKRLPSSIPFGPHLIVAFSFLMGVALFI
jgi:leader peptidase (prepilin peptidase)/N-methyltransferase